MEEEHRLLTLTKTILDSFVTEKLSRFESLFILEAVKASLQEEVIKETVQELLADNKTKDIPGICLLYTSPSPRDGLLSRMPSSA